jgi:outer membrane receptor protein involved in Fe transport
MSALAGAAHAAEPASSPPTTGLTDIVVTAQKRAQNLKSVPISVSALSGEQTRIERIANFDDLSRAAPGVAFDSSGTEGVTNISIRGVSSTAGSATTGLYIDDVSVTTKNLFYEGAIEPRLADLDRIEVLRGPQGTLYGDSSEGGTIRYLSEAPNMHAYTAVLTGDLSDTYRGGENHALSADVNLPIVRDVFAVRVSASSTYDSGWINHYTQDIVDGAAVGGGTLDRKGVNSDHVDTVHIIGKITPGWDLTITPAFYYQHTYVNDSSAFYLNTPGLGIYDEDKEVQEYGRDTFSVASLDIRKGLGFADLTSVTGLFQRDHARQEDGTFFNSTTFAEAFLATVPLPNPVDPSISPNQALNIIGNLPSAVKLNTHYIQFTQEFRLSSPDAGPDQKLHWVAGLYFAQQSVHNTDFQQIPTINSTFLKLYGETLENSSVEGAFNGGVPNTVLFPDDIDEYDNRTYKESQYSGFGQIDYDPWKGWHIGLGGRYQVAAEHFDSVETGFYQIGNISPYYQQATARSFTPKVTVSHDVTPEETVYASAGEGFRLGGPTGPITFGPNTVCAGDFAAINQTVQPTHFASDSLWTYELGSKGQFFGNRLSLNGAGFYTNWRNIQQQIYLPTCGYYFTENVGDAQIYGGELEAAFKVTSHLRVDASIDGESATITHSINPIDVPVGSNLIDVPAGTATAGATYSRPITDSLRLLARIDYDWTGHSYGSFQSVNPNFYNPAYSVLNASVALMRGGYSISLYGKNLLNDQTIIQSPEINTVVEGYTVHPRVIGVTLKGEF